MAMFASGRSHLNSLARFSLAAAGLLAFATSALAACEDIARIPLVSGEAMSAKGASQGLICVWQTDEKWAPPEECGNQGFEVVGWGDRPPLVEFKRRNTYYSKKWETRDAQPEGADSPTWTSASLESEDLGNRCFAGWCTPVNYILRTAEPVSEKLCGQVVELRVLMTDATE